MNLVYTTKCSGFLSFRSPESICPTRSGRDRKREIVPSTVFPSKGKLGAFYKETRTDSHKKDLSSHACAVGDHVLRFQKHGRMETLGGEFYTTMSKLDWRSPNAVGWFLESCWV